MELLAATTIDIQEFDNILRQNILKYWQENMLDHEHGGFYGRIDGYGKLHTHSEKSIILNTRILWTFSAAFKHTREEIHLKVADRAYEYLVNHFVDMEHGGVYWMLDHLGNPTVTKKQVYAQSFGIYALSEYYQVSKNACSIELAKDLFVLIEKHAFDRVNNGYIEALDQDWSPLADVRLSEKDMNAEKTMNTHLHILEAYTNLYRCWQSPNIEKQLRNLISIMSDQFIATDHHLHLFFSKDWQLLSEEVSFGHDIEASWLLHEAAEVLGDPIVIAQTKLLAVAMVKAALEGLDIDGGLMNESRDGELIDTDKHWWPQAEAMVGLVNAWQISGDVSYLNRLLDIWNFTKTRIIDSTGEWHWRVNRDGEVILDEDKAGPWKCPYHNGRAMIELIHRLGQ